jgi:hypothetical protein
MEKILTFSNRGGLNVNKFVIVACIAFVKTK